MKMKTFKERVLRQKEQPNIYMQKTQGPKASMSSPNLDLRFKSKTLLNKQNQQPNLANRVQKPSAENTFGAAKMMMRKSVDEFKLQLDGRNQEKVLSKELLRSLKNSQPDFNILSKSNKFERCSTERSLNTMNPFSKRHQKTEECQGDENTCPFIEDCELIRSEYESSQESYNEEELHFSKSYQRPMKKMNNSNNIIIHENLNYEEERPRQLVTFGPSEARNLKKYQFSRDQEREIKNKFDNNMIIKTKAQIMRSCDFDTASSLVCVNHINKKAKYRLNAALTDEQEECFYCSKCAINLARQDFDIQEISRVDRKMIMSRQHERQLLSNSVEFTSLQSQRQQQFFSYEKRLLNLKNKISAKLKLFNQKSQGMTKIDKKIELTISNYDNLIEILKQMKQQEIIKQENFKKQKSLDIHLKKDELSTILNNIKDTFSEINNERNKLMALKNKEFAFMFDSYIKKLASYEEYLTNLQQTQLAQDIAAFDANLEYQELNEETMVHQIFDEMYKKLTRPKLQVLDSLINQQVPLRKSKDLNRTNEIQSGGSSMFYCEEELQESRPPFRRLFQNHKAGEPNINSSNNFDDSLNVNSSVQNLAHGNIRHGNMRYFKEQNYLPSIQHHK